MYYHAETNTYVRLGQAFTINGGQYPGNWLRLASAQEIADVGLAPVTTEGEYQDDTRYFNTEELVGSVRRIISTLKPQEMLDQLADNERKQQIATLEAFITPRRLREALLTGDKSFIEGVEAEITALRPVVVPVDANP